MFGCGAVVSCFVSRSHGIAGCPWRRGVVWLDGRASVHGVCIEAQFPHTVQILSGYSLDGAVQDKYQCDSLPFERTIGVWHACIEHVKDVMHIEGGAIDDKSSSLEIAQRDSEALSSDVRVAMDLGGGVSVDYDARTTEAVLVHGDTISQCGHGQKNERVGRAR